MLRSPWSYCRSSTLLFQKWKYEQESSYDGRRAPRRIQNDPRGPAHEVTPRKVQRELAQQRLASGRTESRRYRYQPNRASDRLAVRSEDDEGTYSARQRCRPRRRKDSKIALEHGIPIVERKPLAQALFRQVDVGKPIPTTEYAAVAEVLKYVYQVKGKSIDDLTNTLKDQTHASGNLQRICSVLDHFPLRIVSSFKTNRHLRFVIGRFRLDRYVFDGRIADDNGMKPSSVLDSSIHTKQWI